MELIIGIFIGLIVGFCLSIASPKSVAVHGTFPELYAEYNNEVYQLVRKRNDPTP